MEEIWRDISGFKGLYEISNYGRVRSLRKKIKWKGTLRTMPERILKLRHAGKYYRIVLYKNGKREDLSLGRLVAKTFVPNPENKPEVNHEDRDTSNNRADNLTWMTPSENVQHSFRVGTRKMIQGEEHRWSKLTNKEVVKIRKLKEENPKLSYAELGRRYDVTPEAISRIVKHVSWKHI